MTPSTKAGSLQGPRLSQGRTLGLGMAGELLGHFCSLVLSVVPLSSFVIGSSEPAALGYGGEVVPVR